MSTWTSRLRAGAALVAAPVLLAGCIAEGVLPFPALGTPQPASAPAEPRVLADSVVVAAPEGWCPDPRAGLEGEAGSFLLIGPCRTGPVPPVPAILTLSVLGTAPRVGVEAGVAQGWADILGHNSAFVGMTGFGASAKP